MATTLTISVTAQDLHDLKQNLGWSASKIFRDAMFLQRSMVEFMDLYAISDYKTKILELHAKISFLGKEIERRQTTIDSLNDVLAEKERQLRRI